MIVTEEQFAESGSECVTSVYAVEAKMTYCPHPAHFAADVRTCGQQPGMVPPGAFGEASGDFQDFGVRGIGDPRPTKTPLKKRY